MHKFDQPVFDDTLHDRYIRNMQDSSYHMQQQEIVTYEHSLCIALTVLNRKVQKRYNKPNRHLQNIVLQDLMYEILLYRLHPNFSVLPCRSDTSIVQSISARMHIY